MLTDPNAATSTPRFEKWAVKTRGGLNVHWDWCRDRAAAEQLVIEYRELRGMTAEAVCFVDLRDGEYIASIDAAEHGALPPVVPSSREQFLEAVDRFASAVRSEVQGEWGGEAEAVAAAKLALLAAWDGLQQRSDEGHAAHGRSFAALHECAMLANMDGVDDYSEVPRRLAVLLNQAEANR